MSNYKKYKNVNESYINIETYKYFSLRGITFEKSKQRKSWSN